MFFDLQKDTVVETFSSFDKFEILFSDQKLLNEYCPPRSTETIFDISYAT